MLMLLLLLLNRWIDRKIVKAPWLAHEAVICIGFYILE